MQTIAANLAPGNPVGSCPPRGFVSRDVQPVSRPQRVTGRIARHDDPTAIQAVRLEDGREGYRVGPQGRIYASRPAAVSFAKARGARMVRIGGLQ